MTQQPLRSVRPGDTGARARKSTVAEAAATGDELATQISIRDRLAVAITDPDCAPRDLASLTKRLGDTMEAIKTLQVRAAEAGEELGAVDDAYDAEAL